MTTIRPSFGAHSHSSPHPPLVAAPPDAACDTIVAIPARDEEAGIEDTLCPLARQVDATGRSLVPASYEILLLANDCRDSTVEIARRFAASRPELALHVIEVESCDAAPHAGRARRLVMDEAHRRLMLLARPAGIIATTDGDTRVAPDWLSATRAEIRRGADAVGGRIRLPRETLRSLTGHTLEHHLRDVGYRALLAELEAHLDPELHDPWPRHFQHFGASLAVTASMYERAGGIPTLPWHEDVAFHDALVRHDARIRHSPRVQVTTSARKRGRTGYGFAVQLTRWEAMSRAGVYPQVESAAASEDRIVARSALRALWRARQNRLPRHEITSVAELLVVDRLWLRDELSRSPTFGILLQSVEHMQHTSGAWRERWPLVDIRTAIWDLRCRLGSLRPRASGRAPLEQVEPVSRLAPVHPLL